MKDTRFYKLRDLVYSMDGDDLIPVWNDYCSAVNYYDDEIFYMSELDDIFCCDKPSEFLEKLADDFHYNEAYFKCGIWGIESTDDAKDWMDLDELANFINEHEHDYDIISDIRDFFWNWDEDEEEVEQ